MSETKIELHQRKIRAGIRKSKEAQKKQMWQKLATVPPPPDVPITVYRCKRAKGKSVWYCPTAADPALRWVDNLSGENADMIIIDEFAQYDGTK